jgi:hypothetical protein
MTAAIDYNTIVISPEPRGRFIDATISGTDAALLPGTVVQIKAATEKVGGNFTYELYNRDASGNRPRGPIGILVEDNLQGKTITDNYLDTTLARIYFPLPGDELLMRLQDVAGTGDSHAIGDILSVEDATGHLVAETGESGPFVCFETVTEPTADTLAHVQFGGH